jgi:outer membrane protein assembly factor BamD
MIQRALVLTARRATLRAGLLVFTVLLAMGAAGCRGGVKEDPILQLSAAEALAEGKRLLAAEKHSQARRYLAHAFEIEPNSVSGREALLLVADALYLQGGTDNLIQAEAKYRDFLNRFPTSDRAPYVQLQIGNALAGRVERPDRDQSVTLQAVTAFEELLRLYPASQEAAGARERIGDLRQRLAEHEFMVAWFYYRYGLPNATANRLQELLVTYPEYQAKDKVYYHLGLALTRMAMQEEAAKWFTRLREEYPASEYVGEIPAATQSAEMAENAEDAG